MAKLVIIVGIVIVLVGILLAFKVPLGNLPGDIVFQGENMKIYFPIVTCIVLSIVLSLLFYLFSS